MLSGQPTFVLRPVGPMVKFAQEFDLWRQSAEEPFLSLSTERFLQKLGTVVFGESDKQIGAVLYQTVLDICLLAPMVTFLTIFD